MRALLPILFALSGCHQVFPHAPGAPGKVSTAPDLAAPDAPRSPEIGPPPDLQPLELGLDVPAPKKDGGVMFDLASCAEADTINTTAACKLQCVSPPLPDFDCDGLPDGRDPAMTACNPLLRFEHFTSTSPSTKWTGANGVSWPCGAASLKAGATLTLSAAELSAIAGKLTTGGFLLEVKYTLGALPSGPWSVRLELGKAGNPPITCEQWTNPGYNVYGMSRLLPQSWCGTSSGSWKSGTNDTSPGAVYYLQLYNSGPSVSCQLTRESSVVDGVTSSPCTVAGAPESLSLFTSREITVDQIRIFLF